MITSTPTCCETCECGHRLDDHNEDGCMYPDPAREGLVFCPCSVRTGVVATVSAEVA